MIGLSRVSDRLTIAVSLVVLSIVVSGIGGAWNATPIDGDMRLSCEKLRWVYGGDRRRGAIHHRRCSRTRLWNGSTP